MRRHRLMAVLLILVLPAAVFIAGCSDDDNPNDPNKGYQQVDIRLHSGDQFTYDRYDLDENNQKITESKRKYEVEFLKGSSFLISYRDWYYRFGVDRSTSERDTMYIRTETITRSSDNTAYTESLMAYGFVYDVLQMFISEVMEFQPDGIPTIPGETWDVIARYYDDEGNALDPGAEWELGPEGGILMNFTFSGIPVAVEATMKGVLDAREEKIMANNQELTTWKSSIIFNLNVANSTEFDVKLSFWVSDNPGTMVRVVQESATVTLPVLGPLTINGETQELVSWF